MHMPVWIITPVTDQRELGLAFQKARELAEPFSEKNWNDSQNPDEQIYPPISWDYILTGGRWDGDIRLDEDMNHNTGREAAMVPDRNMPLVVMAPNGYIINRAWEEDPETLRSILLNWPENIVIAQDWHY